MAKFFQEFREFAVKGNVVDMAVGIIIGGAFTLIVQSLVADVMNPLIGLLVGGVDFSNLFVVLRQGAIAGPYATLASAQAAGAVTFKPPLPPALRRCHPPNLDLESIKKTNKRAPLLKKVTPFCVMRFLLPQCGVASKQRCCEE